jgi:MFS transporter, PAT family, beta-lactamase induction signal transducer AmpG
LDNGDMTEKTVTDQTTFSWLASWRVYVQPASLRMLFLGFAAGLPLLLVLGTLSFRLREAGIDRSTIGYLSWGGFGLRL